MNLKPDRQDLLNDLLATDQGNSPALDTVLGSIRRERAARIRRRQGVMTLFGVVLLAGSLVVWQRQNQGPALVAALHSSNSLASPSSPGSVDRAENIQQLSDDQLLDLFEDQPAAVVTLPDGRQRLLLIVEAAL